MCGGTLWIISWPYVLGWRKTFCVKDHLFFPNTSLHRNYIPKLQHGSFYSKMSCIYNKWFTLDCNVFDRRFLLPCPLPTKKVTNENSRRLSKDEERRPVSPLLPKGVISQNKKKKFKCKVSTTKWDLVNILNSRWACKCATKFCATFMLVFWKLCMAIIVMRKASTTDPSAMPHSISSLNSFYVYSQSQKSWRGF